MDDLVSNIAESHEVDSELINKLIEYEQTKIHLKLRRGAKHDIKRLIEKHLGEEKK